jgi:hypothetical protein
MAGYDAIQKAAEVAEQKQKELEKPFPTFKPFTGRKDVAPAQTFSNNEQARVDLQRAAVEAEVAPIVSNWKGGPKLTIVPNVQALPENIRTALGDDIDAACGQLAGDVKDRTQVQSRMAQQRTISLVPVHTVRSQQNTHDNPSSL